MTTLARRSFQNGIRYRTPTQANMVWSHLFKARKPWHFSLKRRNLKVIEAATDHAFILYLERTIDTKFGVFFSFRNYRIH